MKYLVDYTYHPPLAADEKYSWNSPEFDDLEKARASISKAAQRRELKPGDASSFIERMGWKAIEVYEEKGVMHHFFKRPHDLVWVIYERVE